MTTERADNIVRLPKPARVQRQLSNWLTSFLDYSKHGEAPKRMYFWVGVSAVAGALERRVWIDQRYFRWYPNMYVIMVAPPGVVSKSTTADLAMRLLARVPGITFGSSIVTWQSLIKEFTDCEKMTEIGGEHITMSALTIVASELGNTLDTKDNQMVDLFTSLWDGKTIQKSTKYGGVESVQNPCINLIGCTTPAWVAGNFPEYMIGGGLTSRCVFLYADKKEKCVAYPSEHVPRDMDAQEAALVNDLTAISQLSGEFKLTKEALEWGTTWYNDVFQRRPVNLSDARFDGYMARKQTHLHKLAMVLSAAEGASLSITATHLGIADAMLKDLEPDLAFVFSKAGREVISHHTERLIQFVHQKGQVTLAEAYRFVHSYFPYQDKFQAMMEGCVKAGYLILQNSAGGMLVLAGDPLPTSGLRG